MVRISVPVRGGVEAGRSFRFRVQPLGVLLAGSRSGVLPEALCRQVVRRLAGEGFAFFVGCAAGVDRSFRLALAQENLADKSFVACASRERLRRSCGLFASVVVPRGLSMAAALHRRTVWIFPKSRQVLSGVLFPPPIHRLFTTVFMPTYSFSSRSGSSPSRCLEACSTCRDSLESAS